MFYDNRVVLFYMNLVKETKELCKKYNIKPLRSKGQNFLITESVYDKIIKTADLKPDDVVLEVGPGLGFLTEKLGEKVKKVITVELDDKIANALNKRLREKNIKNVQVVNKNVLDIISDIRYQIPDLFENYKVVANLPYNITSIFLRKMLSQEKENKPDSMVLMLQKEVAERIIARPPKMSLLAISVQFYSRPEIISYINKENFWPEPKVDSAIVQLKIKNYQPKADPPWEDKLKIKNIDEKDFFRLVKIGFSAKRKMLKNNLSAGFGITGLEVENKLKNAGFSKKIRAGELSVKDWIKLMKYF